MGRLAKVLSGQVQPGVKAYKKGGAVHDDEAADKKLISKMLKEEDKGEAKKRGGPVKKCSCGKVKR